MFLILAYKYGFKLNFMKTVQFCFLIILFCLFSCGVKTPKSIQVEFERLETKSKVNLRGLFVVNENVVWASGSEGTVLLSLDSGETWKENKIKGAEGNDFRSIHAWDEKRAIVFGVSGPAFGYASEDGGENWEVIYQDTTSGLFFNSLKFADKNNGLAISDPVDGKFFVLRTEDGGRKWERVINLPKVELGEANFAASNTCMEYLPSGKAWFATGGKAARVFYSSDFGKSWNVARTPMVRGAASSGIFSIAFKNDLQGVIVGGTYDAPELNQNIASYTLDGGKTWHPAETMPKEYRSCVQHVYNSDENLFFAIGKTGCDVSFDRGENWQFINESGFYTFRAVPGQLVGFVAGSDGMISKLDLKR